MKKNKLVNYRLFRTEKKIRKDSNYEDCLILLKGQNCPKSQFLKIVIEILLLENFR